MSKTKPKAKPKQQQINEAFDALKRAVALPDPDISINVQFGAGSEDEMRKFLIKVKELTIEYQRTFGKKATLSMWFD